MKNTVDFLKKNLETEFSLKDFQDKKFFPWARNYRTLVKLVTIDGDEGNILKTRISGTGAQTRYFIKGKHIIKYLEKYGSGFMMTTRLRYKK